MGKYDKFMEDPDVERWYANLARGSISTAKVYFRRLGLFCNQNNLSPKQLVMLGQQNRKQLEDLVQDHTTKMEMENKSPGYIEGILKSVRSWLLHNEIELKRRIKISNRGATPTLEDERVPNKEELKTLLMYSDERTSAIICLIAQSGLRLEVLGNATGDDALTIRDLPELKVHENVEFVRIPTTVVVRPSLSKVSHRYLTFLPKEGCDYLKAYLEKRLSDGEKLTPKTPVIANKIGYRNGKTITAQIMTTKNISRLIREAMRPRFEWRPYVLRSYFATQMLLAESHGKVSHPYRVFFMGHKGDIEARYSTNKGILPEEVVEDMRRAFTDSTEYLESTIRSQKDNKEMLLEMWRQQAKMYGIDPLKVKIEKERELGSELSIDEEQEILMHEIQLRMMPQINNADKPYQSKIVKEDGLVSHIEEGWEIIRELSDGKFLIKRPNHIKK
jgi:integrase